MNTFYLPRQLYKNDDKDQLIAQNQLLTAQDKLIIVLAEPGAGKTSLLDDLAKQANVQKYTAKAFAYVPNVNTTKTLIIDGFDEWARNQQNEIHALLDNAQRWQPEKIILSSRSGEWLAQHTQACEEMLGCKAQIFYLSAFSEAEQTKIFANFHPNHDFTHFLQAATRIELSPLLGNPLFFKLFADAYVEQNGQFTTKRKAFESAMIFLAKEDNPNYVNTLPREQKLSRIENVFAKLLLAGSEGIALSDRAENQLFPHIRIVLDTPDIQQILHTRFFQAADEAERHRPIHRIVVEYCAAKNLLERINQPTNPLRLSQCLSIVAPNGVVREDLRGLVAWLAALSESREIQEKLIELDPYAVIANGEPSLLLPTSKRKLLQKLQQLNAENPYFRRSDRWRSFSVSGFFTEDTVTEVSDLLSEQAHQGDLQRLLLELLLDAPILPALAQPLQNIVRYIDEERKDWYVRTLAGELICQIPDYPHKDEWQFLLETGDTQSLKIAAIIMDANPDIFQAADFEQFLRQCAKLYPDDKYGLNHVIGERYFVRQFIQTLPLNTVEFLLNQLSAGLSCVCGKEAYDCDCRHGISNIISMLLDNFFEHKPEPYHPEQIWSWLKNLHFLSESRNDDTLSAQVLQKNTELRQGILRLAFEKEADREESIQTIRYNQFGSYGHIGLRLQPQDCWYLVDLAFETDNVELWKEFRQVHIYDKEKQDKSNPLRHHMRKQALQKTEFLKVWYRNEQNDKKRNFYYKKKQYKYNKRQKQSQHKNMDIRKQKYQDEIENYKKIRNSLNFDFLQLCADFVLSGFKATSLITMFDDESSARDLLFNCIDFIEPNIPTLDELAQLQRVQGKLKFSGSQHILYAASLEILKREQNLNRLSKKALLALRTHLDMHYLGVSDEERTMLHNECNRLLFPDKTSAESFLRAYIEPQLVDSQCKHPHVAWLTYDDVFKPFQATLPFEWLQRFDDMPEYAYGELFQQAALHGDLVKLKSLIAKKCADLAKQHPKIDKAKLKQKRKFWYLQAFYFLDFGYKKYWKWLKTDKNLIFKLDNDVGSLKNKHYIELSAEKIELMLNAFMNKWEKVDLPSMYGTGSPKPERAYRFLSHLIEKIGTVPNDNPIPTLKRLLSDKRYKDFYPTLKSQLFHHVRQQKIQNVVMPTMKEVIGLLENHEIISVENMRALVLEELAAYQADLDGSEFTSKAAFYNGEKHVDENRATQIVDERLRLKLERYGIDCHSEQLMSDNKRCDFTCAKRIHDKQNLLVVEAKGQWDPKLYSAIENQLFPRYMSHPNAENQGIFLVYWFGVQEKLASVKNTMTSAAELKSDIENKMPNELKGLVDVFVLDVSR